MPKSSPQPRRSRTKIVSPQPAAAEAVTLRETKKQVIALAFDSPSSTIRTNGQSVVELEHEQRLLTETIRAEEQELGKANFWYFVTEICFPHTWKDHYSDVFHRDLCDEIQALKQGEDLWAFLSREARKSFLFNILHDIWLIVKDPNVRILLIGAREETVKPFARVVRSAFIEGTPGWEKFQDVFAEHIYRQGDKMLKQQFQFDAKLKTRVTGDPTFRASYLGVAGAGWRTDVLKFDDAIERRNVASPEMSIKTLGQMMDLFPLVDTNSPYGNIIGVGTRWGYHDPYGRIIGEVDGPQGTQLTPIERKHVKVIVRHAFEDPNRPCEHCPPHVVAKYPHGHPDMEKGVPIMAPIHTRETLIKRYNQYLQDPELGESMFWHQYMNVCMAPGDKRFEEAWFHDMHIPRWPAAKRRILAIDSADKDFQTLGIGDNMVALFGEYDDTGRLMVAHGLYSNAWTREEFIRRIVSHCIATDWWPTYAVKEKFGTDSFLADVRREFLRVNRPIHCHAESRASMQGNQTRKFDWIVACLQGPMERGEIVWGSNFPRALRERAKYELTNLGQVAKDDIADTLALFLVPAIRVPLADQGPRVVNWERPLMENEWGMPQAPPNQSPYDEAIQRAGVIKTFNEFGTGVIFDPPDPPTLPGWNYPSFEKGT